MRKSICLIALLLLGTALSCNAQLTLPKANLNYVMPTGVDPVNLTFTFDGEQLAFFGRDVMPDPDNPSAPFGVEFRTDGILKVGEFIITMGNGSYIGNLQITSLVDPDYESFVPWDASEPGRTMGLLAVQGSALVGDPDTTLPLPGLPLHSILQYTGGLDGSDLDAFRDQQFLVIARAVPEPGALTAMAAAVLVIGTAALRRRRQ